MPSTASMRAVVIATYLGLFFSFWKTNNIDYTWHDILYSLYAVAYSFQVFGLHIYITTREVRVK